MDSIKTSDEFKLGQKGEAAVSFALKSKGWFVLDAYDYSGNNGLGAPALKTHLRKIIIPDLLCCKRNESRWVEVKTKTQAGICERMSNMKTHCIEDRLCRHYLDVKSVSGISVWLAICERDTGALLWRDLEELLQFPGTHKWEMRGRQKIFFPRHAFEILNP